MILRDFLTPLFDLAESSGYSLQGSMTRDLTISKIWLLDQLREIQDQFSTMYVLGSWYGNLALYLTLQPDIDVGEIILVDQNPRFLQTSRRLLDLAGANNVRYMLGDSNDVDYRQLGEQGVVINTSLTDMPGRRWFDRIPPGTLVCMQARDHDPNQQFRSTDDILAKFPLSQVRYAGTKRLQDPETKYQRFMVIGVK